MLARIALALLTISSALAAPHSSNHLHRRGYKKDANKLEPYDQYTNRFNQLGCGQETGTDFYQSCCHPLQKGQSLSSRPDYCDPNSSYYSDCNNNNSTSPHSTPTTVKTTPADFHQKAKPATTTNPSSGGGSWNSGGFATYFFQNGVAGACGQVHSDNDLIAAIDQDRYGDASQKSSLCGKQVKIINTNNQKSVVVTIADDCPTCTNSNSIDLSKGAFTQIATTDEGQVPIKWQMM